MATNTSRLLAIIADALREDIGEGDHTSRATVPEDAKRTATLHMKDGGIIAGVELAQQVFQYVDPHLEFVPLVRDGALVSKGDIAFRVTGSPRSILSAERTVLNFMQRMSGIATKTRQFTQLIDDLPTQLLDTRKTTPCVRHVEKWAVRIGGGKNHRLGLDDMMLIKDNHIDYAGGIGNAIAAARNYLRKNEKNIRIEIETRSSDEVREVLSVGGVDRIMLDNFSPDQIREVLQLIGNAPYETEVSGNIDAANLRTYALTGVDFISSGALTHSYQSLDMSLKAELA